METRKKNDICIVGYALNKKKLRKGGSAAISSVSVSQSLSPTFENNTLVAISCNEKVKSERKESFTKLSPSVSTNGPSSNTSPQVWKGGGLADLLKDKDDSNVRFLPVDFDKPVEEQPDFHVIIHKLTEDIRAQDPDSKAKLNLLSDYLRKHPQTVLVDPIDAVQRVISRSTVCHVLQRIISQYTMCSDASVRLSNASSTLTLPLPPSSSAKEVSCKKQRLNPCQQTVPMVYDFPCPFSQPKFLIVEDISEISALFAASDLSFPVICKPLEACGTPTSHSMVVAVDFHGLSMVKIPSVIQEYKDHNSSFFKVYVIDQDVMVYQRPSLPNLQAMLRREQTCDVNESCCDHGALKSILFDSRYAYPSKASFFDGPPPLTPSPLKPASSSVSSPFLTTTLTDTVAFVEPYVRTRKPSAADLSDPSLTTYQEQFEVIALALRKEFGLTLFGFDCIIPSSSHDGESNLHTVENVKGCLTYSQDNPTNIEIIDVNFFPSYKEVEDFPQKLKGYLRKRAGLS